MHRIHRTLCLISLAVLFLAMAQGVWHFIPMRGLRGIWVMEEAPRLTARGFHDGSWQPQMEKYLRGHFGFNEAAIRLYNQYVFSGFHRTTNKGLIIGRDGYLYERYFVEDHYESRMYKYTEKPEELLAGFDLEARRLALLQRQLAERGTTLFVVIPPGKDFLYPEHLPARDTLTRPLGPRAYPEYPRLFDRYGVNYVDILGWFLQLKECVDYDIMMPLGTHWSNIAATYAFDSILRYMQGLGGAAIRPVQLGTPYVDKTRQPDDDLGRLLNTTFIPRQKRCQYVDVTLAPAEATQQKPGMITVGDSFFWTISYNYPLDSLFRYAHYWFYNSTIYFDAEHDNVSQVDLRQTLDDADYIMLIYCSGQLYDLGNGFIVNALLALNYSDEEIAAVRDSISDNIRADEHWLGYLREKAANEGIDLDQAIYNDAEYLIHTRPEEFFEKVKTKK